MNGPIILLSSAANLMDIAVNDTDICPCGSGKQLTECCGPVLDGRPARSADQLMRSRYSAYVLGNSEYLRRSWHPATRPSRVRIDDTRWLSLTVESTEQGGVEDVSGKVSFTAAFMDKGECRLLHETSRFEKIDGHWYYLDGDCRIEKPGRNDPCPCGSGKKLKRCCGHSVA